jgi:large subunit ribosomal protein L18
MKPRLKRQRRVRVKIHGTTERPRVNIFRSNKFIYGQIIDDTKGHTLAHATGKITEEVATKLAIAAKKKKISLVVFDRAGYAYLGRVKKFAEKLREEGLKF